jgi:iron(III) transport system substrate-binding protein
LPDFQKEFPEIKVVAVTGRGNEIGQRIAAERRAEKYLADVVSAGANPNYQQFYRGKMVDPIKPALILPEVLDQAKWYEGKHTYADPEGQYVFVYVGSATYGAINYNTKLVDSKEFKSYWDLLDPKWKGKIEARDVRRPGPGSGNMRFFYHHPDIGANFIQRLFSEMEISLFKDYRQGSDWLATGKFAICFFCDVDTMKQQGLPVDTFGPKIFKEGGGLVQQFGTVVLMKNAPHPNAAKVFINWLLSPDGQTSLQKRTANAESPADSLRIDIAKDDVPYESRRLAGVNYLDTGRADWIDMKPIYQIINQALAKP